MDVGVTGGCGGNLGRWWLGYGGWKEACGGGMGGRDGLASQLVAGEPSLARCNAVTLLKL